MKDESSLISIYSGNEASVHLLKGKLEREGICSEIRKESQAGYWGVVPDNIELFINSSDKEIAKPVIDEFLQTDKVEKL